MLKKYKCPYCLTTKNVIKYRKRGSSIQYKCNLCIKLFSIRVIQKSFKEEDLLLDHLDGFSFSIIGERYGISKTSAYRIVSRELKKLPDNNNITKSLCGKFGDIIVPDGKYISVKGYDRKIPFLWGIDYLRHDFPVILFATGESYVAWKRYFHLLREIHTYNLIVCDDNASLQMAAEYEFPKVKIQLCYNHLKENIRRDLKIRKDNTYKPLMRLIEETLAVKRSESDFDNRMFYIFKQYRDDPIALSVITRLVRNKEKLLAFRGFLRAPMTSNIIECFNSHLECRLKALKGFESFDHAELWLNAYVLKRRQTKFKECTGYFRKFNGKRPIDQTLKNESVGMRFI